MCAVLLAACGTDVGPSTYECTYVERCDERFQQGPLPATGCVTDLASYEDSWLRTCHALLEIWGCTAIGCEIDCQPTQSCVPEENP